MNVAVLQTLHQCGLAYDPALESEIESIRSTFEIGEERITPATLTDFVRTDDRRLQRNSFIVDDPAGIDQDIQALLRMHSAVEDEVENITGGSLGVGPEDRGVDGIRYDIDAIGESWCLILDRIADRTGNGADPNDVVVKEHLSLGESLKMKIQQAQTRPPSNHSGQPETVEHGHIRVGKT